MTEWKPIADAPYDQRWILGVNDRSGLMYVTHRYAVGSDIYVRFNEGDGRGWRPTHFVTLPTPPSRRSAS